MPQKLILPRRTLIASTLAMPAILSGTARADAGRVVIGTWGGDYARLLHDNVEQPLLIPKGFDVVQDANDEAPRIAKMYAQSKLARGALDVACMQAVGGFRVNDSGLVEKLDATKVPNLAHVEPALRNDYFAPHIYSLQVIIYNPDKITTPPQSFADLLDPKYAGKVGVGDQNFFYGLMAAGQFANGNHTDFEAAKAQMLKLNANGMRLYPATDNLATAFSSGEIVIGLIWLARVVMWQNAGVPVKAAFPKEGCITYISGMVVPKNAPDKEGAFAYLNAMLDPSAQKLFAERMGYLPTVDNCTLTGKTAEQLAFPTPTPKIVVPDYAVTSKALPEMQEWWKKSIQHT